MPISGIFEVLFVKFLFELVTLKKTSALQFTDEWSLLRRPWSSSILVTLEPWIRRFTTKSVGLVASIKEQINTREIEHHLENLKCRKTFKRRNGFLQSAAFGYELRALCKYCLGLLIFGYAVKLLGNKWAACSDADCEQPCRLESTWFMFCRDFFGPFFNSLSKLSDETEQSRGSRSVTNKVRISCSIYGFLTNTAF